MTGSVKGHSSRGRQACNHNRRQSWRLRALRDDDFEVQRVRISGRWRRDGGADPPEGLERNPARTDRNLAICPARGPGDQPERELSGLHLLGPGDAAALQRRLEPDPRRPASLDAGPAGARGLARHLGRDRPDVQPDHGHGRGGPHRGRAAGDAAPGQDRRALFQLQCQPDPRRGRDRRPVQRRHRDDRPRAGGAARRTPAVPGECHLPRPQPPRDLRPGCRRHPG
jgi:hypothetical protein